MNRILTLLLALALALAVQAEAIELRQDHPREYVVQAGDTLWDIAARFLTHPWQWPEIWQANPGIDNPHLIYPGDVLSLVFVGGEPRLIVDDTVRRLSPGIRSESMDRPITTLPLEAIAPFLRHSRVVGALEFEHLPYILTHPEQRLLAESGQRTIARGLGDAQVGDEFVIGRLAYQFVDRSEAVVGERGTRRNRLRGGPAQVAAHERPSSEIWQNTLGRLDGLHHPIIGYEFHETATARVIQAGDPAILMIGEGRREVMAGDRLLPVDDYRPEVLFFPRAMDRVPQHARVLSLTEAHFGVGHFQIVAINVGQADGVEPGHVFSAFRPGPSVRDNLRYPRMSRAAFESPDRVHVTLPDEYAGQLMVFRTFERISYAMVLDGTQAIRINDQLDHPSRAL